MKGIYYNPIQFYVAQSLSLNINDKKATIKTTSSSITFIILVDQATG